MNAITKFAGRVLVWDLPTRVFHWLFALSFAGAWITAESERWRDVHVLLGYTMLVLVVFRLAWGLVGTRHARFSALRPSFARAFDYLRSLVRFSPQHHAGHNPAGTLAILLLIALGLASALSGLATFNEVGGHAMEEVHEALASAMLAVVVVHIAGVIVGSIAHRENLPAAMVTGRKRAAPEEAIRGARPVAAALLVALVVGVWVGAVPTPGLSTSALTQVTAPHADSAHASRDDDHD